MPHYVDEPAEGALVQRHSFTLRGWVYDASGEIRRIIVSSNGQDLGATALFFPRADANAHLDLDPGTRTGFLFDCIIPEALRGAEQLRFAVEGEDVHGIRFLLEQRTVRLSAYDYRAASHGYQFQDDFDITVPRESIYATGPPAREASADVIDLLTRYLEPGQRTLDVGCGIGAVGRAFARLDIPWTGCEIRADFVEIARADGLDVRLVADGRLPFEDDSFDVAFAVEVLEHVRDPRPFLAEMRRVAPRAAYFTVPNFESVAITASFYALPWHMLEPDHWNFYGRGSLKALLREFYDDVEVFEFGPVPLLNTLDHLPIFNHVFAIARNPQLSAR